jgi:hypothetical protein
VTDSSGGAVTDATVTITNNNPSGSPSLLVRITQDLAPPFTLPTPATCEGITLAPNSGCTLAVEFSPTVTGLVEDSFIVTVGNRNTPPRFTTTPPLFALEGTELSLTLIAGDLDGDPISFKVLGELPAGTDFDPGSGLLTWTPGFGQAGNYTLRFSATDPLGASVETSIRIQVLNTNRAPVLASVSGRVLLVGQQFRFILPATDPDTGTTLTYSAANLPAGAAVNAQTGEFVWTPLAVQVGEHHPRFTVSDGELTASATR